MPQHIYCSFYRCVRDMRGLKGVGLRYGRLLYFQCLIKYMIICAFENPPSIPNFLVTKIVYIGYGQLKKWLLFLLPFHSCALYIFISYCCLCQCQAVCYYYMPVPTKYHWNISFQKKVHRSTFVCCQKCQKCNTICVTTFFYWISMVSQKKKRIKYIQCTPES